MRKQLATIDGQINPVDKVLWHKPDPACVLYLPGYPGYGSRIKDRALGNDGTITGATWTRLPSGLWVLSFDGTDDYILVPNKPSLQITPAITYEFWVNQSVLKDYATFISNGLATAPYMTIRSVNGSFQAIFASANGTESTKAGTTNIATVATWFHLAITLDVSSGSGVSTLYRNGVQNGTQTTANMNSITMTTDYNIGRDNRNDGYLNGYMCGERIYNRVLSASEIANHYNQKRHLFGV